MSETDLTPDEMKARLQADKEIRSQRATKRIQAILEEEQCIMAPVMVLSRGKVDARIEIIAAD